jgi:hypothetical protein
MKTTAHWRWVLALLACALVAWLRPSVEDQPLPNSFAAPPAPTPAAESLYHAPQVDPSEPPQEAAPTF